MSNDITSNYHQGKPESAAAKKLSDKTARYQRARIVALARKRRGQGITCDEAEVVLAMSHQSCSARFSELKRDSILIPTEITRPTRQGGRARVMVIVRD
jgi:hypothetical protein